MNLQVGILYEGILTLWDPVSEEWLTGSWTMWMFGHGYYITSIMNVWPSDWVNLQVGRYQDILSLCHLIRGYLSDPAKWRVNTKMEDNGTMSDNGDWSCWLGETMQWYQGYSDLEGACNFAKLCNKGGSFGNLSTFTISFISLNYNLVLWSNKIKCW